jgi:hypothetical protein
MHPARVQKPTRQQLPKLEMRAQRPQRERFDNAVAQQLFQNENEAIRN